MMLQSLVSNPKRMLRQKFKWIDRYIRRQEEYLKRQTEQTQFVCTSDIPTAPLILRIEVVNLCNANCVFCTYQFQQRHIETMSFDTFKSAVDQFTALGGRLVCFTPLVGEALIDKGLEEKVKYVRQFPQYERLEIWTNGILLTRRRFEDLVKSGVNEFNISMSGFNADEYKDLYRNKNYLKVISNLTDIAESEELKRVRFVIWSRTGLEEPEKEPDYIRLVEKGFNIVCQREMFSWHDQIKQKDLPGTMFLRKPHSDQSKPCFMLWSGFTVMSNGDMTVCGCTDIDGLGLPLGNIRDHPIDEHLRDGRWVELRDAFIKGDPPTFCKGCDMYCPTEMRHS